MRTLSLIFVALILCSFLVPPVVKITVVDKLGNRIEEAHVVVYDNKEDYQKETNPVRDRLTDSKGTVTFKKLEPKVYFIHAYKGDMNNNWAGVQTDTIKANKVNKMIVVIE